LDKVHENGVCLKFLQKRLTNGGYVALCGTSLELSGRRTW